MKVLHVGKYFPPYSGGMENYLRDAMLSLSNMGIDNTALVHQSKITLTSRDEVYESCRQRLSITRAAVWARLLFTPISPTFPWLLNRMINQQKPDILHLHMPNASVFWALLVPRARRLPWVVHWHSDVVASNHSLGLRLFYTLYRPFETAILKRAKAIIATSPPYLESSEPLRPFKSKCHVVPLGINPTSFEAAKPTNTAEQYDLKPLHVLAIGRLTYYKGFKTLIQAAAGADNVVIDIIGSGDQENELRSLVHDLQLEHKVTFLGSLSSEQLLQKLWACDCLCLPSIERTEAFGMVLLEAMACSKATIVSNVLGSGMGWVIDDEVTGVLFTPENASELTDALKTLEQSRDKVVSLGTNGRKKFEQEFHIKKSSAGLKEVYKLILGDGSNDT
jgi:glycosyltransferase involved in cell wall biosynthesis